MRSKRISDMRVSVCRGDRIGGRELKLRISVPVVHDPMNPGDAVEELTEKETCQLIEYLERAREAFLDMRVGRARRGTADRRQGVSVKR